MMTNHHPRSALRLVRYLLLTCCAATIASEARMPTPEPSAREILRPAALKPGDTIALVAPAGELDGEAMERVRRRLIELGYKTTQRPDLLRQRGYLAGDDATRAAELMDAFRNPQVDAIFPGTGGYGATRMLDRLDYDVIRANPKILIGFSDITALHLAVWRRSRVVTFHSPNPMYSIGAENPSDPFTLDLFWRAITPQPDDPRRTVSAPENATAVKTVRGGVAEGRLVGGNLSLVSTLMGTEYEIQTDGCLLFLEDVRERPYRVDRFLSQLRLAGKLDRPAGVILGQFTRSEPKPDESTLSMDQVFDDYFADAPYPVVKNFPVGHHRINATLPIGVLAELNADRGVLTLLESGVTE